MFPTEAVVQLHIFCPSRCFFVLNTQSLVSLVESIASMTGCGYRVWQGVLQSEERELMNQL